jgi:protein O-mannosyl-transferase
MTKSRGRDWLVLAVYIALGTAMYWAALGAFFTSDDFEFLTIVRSAKSWLVIFEPLVGRYVRPLVVLMYYACYKLFGLTPWPYHVATLLPHLAASFLVYLVGLRLFGGSQTFLAFLAGLLFLVFSGHSEAVAWPAGIADPIVAVCLLVSFLCYLRAIEPGAPVRFVVFSYLAMLGAVLTKEVWVTYPGILLAHGVLLGPRDPQARRRAAVLVVATGGTVAVYLVMRQTVFGSVTGGYSGLGTSFGTSLWLAEVHAFVLRCFVPAGIWAVRLWRRLDLIVWPLVAILLLWRVRGRDARVVIFTGVAMMLALLPVLPLSISVATSESERFTYVATVFSCLLVVASASAVLRSRAAVAAACGVLMAWHGVVLVRNSIRWREAGQMARGIIETFAAGVRRYDPEHHQPIFLLNLPDNLMGAYVYRRGFDPAIQLFAPDVADSTRRTFAMATSSFGQLHDRSAAAQTGPNRFALDVSPGRLIQPEILSSSWYRIVSQKPSSYEAEFSDAVTSAIVFHTTGAHVEYVGTTTSRGLAFGSLDTPADGAVCAGTTVRFSGWALDNKAVARVVVDAVGEDGTLRPIGDAPFAPPGSRPDVAGIYSWLPNSSRAEWNYLLPCALVAAAPKGELRVRVTAIDSEGQRTDLGTRLIKVGR